VFVGSFEHCGLENFGNSWRAVVAGFPTFRKKKTEKLLTMQNGC
jgi:hypothetical protein